MDRAVAARVGGTALVFSALYLLSDVIEGIQGGFSAGQLWLTLIAEAAIPLFVLGLYAAQRPHIGRLGRWSAIAYAAAYVFFTMTVAYALARGTPDFDALNHDLAPWMTLGGAVMVLAGLGFGAAAVRAGVLPRWTGIVLLVGVVLDAATQGAPEEVQLLAAATRDLGFAGMGAAVLWPAPGGARLTGPGPRPPRSGRPAGRPAPRSPARAGTR